MDTEHQQEVTVVMCRGAGAGREEPTGRAWTQGEEMSSAMVCVSPEIHVGV